MKQVSPVTLGLPVRQASPVTELQKESLSKFPVVAEREEPAAPPSSLFDDEEVRNTMELLELVSGKPYVASEKKTLPQLQLPKSVELLKEGRVLVRCPWEVEPVCNLNEIPFEDAIHEALGRLGIRHPKPIQSYVWETLLRLTNVAFVSGSKRGKTLGKSYLILKHTSFEVILLLVLQVISFLFSAVCWMIAPISMYRKDAHHALLSYVQAGQVQRLCIITPVN